MNSTNIVVANAMAARGVARNSVEVEVSLMYAGRVQHAMRDAARSVSGVRVTGTNTLSCPDEDAADEVVDILEQAGGPKREISLNAKRVKNSKASGMVAKELNRLTAEARSIYNDIKRKVNEIKKAMAQVSALQLQVDPLVKKILDIEKDGELTIRALDEGDPDWKEAGAVYQRFLHEMWDIKREIP